MPPEQSTKILFVDESETSFQIWECVARALQGLPPLEFVYASDASDGLAKLDQVRPDVVMLNVDEHVDEARVFVESLHGAHPPVVVHALAETNIKPIDGEIFVVDRGGSLEGMHKALLLATAAAHRAAVQAGKDLH